MALGGHEKDRDSNFPAWFETEEQADIADRARPLVAVAALAVIAIFAGIIWYVYNRDGGKSKGPLPTLQADTSPTKVQPEDRGGMDVPNQDKMVYDRGDAKATERLASPPEQPMDKPVAPTTENLTPPAQGAVAQAESAPPPAAATTQAAPAQSASVKPAPVVNPAAIPAPPPPATSASVTNPVTNKDFLAGIEKSLKDEAPAHPPAHAAATEPQGGAAFVQLMALPNKTDVEMAWTRIQKKQADILAGRSSTIAEFQKADGATWYRLRVGPFADRAQALDLCTRLKAHGQDCLVPRS